MLKLFFEHQKYQIHRGPRGKGIAGASHEGSTGVGCLQSKRGGIVKEDNPRVAKVFIFETIIV